MPEHYRDTVFSKIEGCLLEWCPYCGKYVESYMKKIDTLHAFSGRCGDAYYCKECNRELAFLGIIS